MCQEYVDYLVEIGDSIPEPCRALTYSDPCDIAPYSTEYNWYDPTSKNTSYLETLFSGVSCPGVAIDFGKNTRIIGNFPMSVTKYYGAYQGYPNPNLDNFASLSIPLASYVLLNNPESVTCDFNGSPRTYSWPTKQNMVDTCANYFLKEDTGVCPDLTTSCQPFQCVSVQRHPTSFFEALGTAYANTLAFQSILVAILTFALVRFFPASARVTKNELTANPIRKE